MIEARVWVEFKSAQTGGKLFVEAGRAAVVRSGDEGLASLRVDGEWVSTAETVPEVLDKLLTAQEFANEAAMHTAARVLMELTGASEAPTN